MRRQDGFTLVEILVALSVLAIVVVATSALMVGTLNLSRTNKERAVLNTYTQAVLERYRNAWNDQQNFQTAAPPSLANLPTLPRAFTTRAPEVRFRWLRADRTEVPSSSSEVPALREVRVIVYRGTASAADVKTWIGNPAVSNGTSSSASSGGSQ